MAQEGFLCYKVALQPQNGLELATKTPKIIPKVALLALSGELTGGTLIIYNSIFIKWPWVNLLGLKRGSYITKLLPDQKIAWIGQKRPKSSVTSATNRCTFIKWPLKPVKALTWVPTLQSGSPATNKYGLNWQKKRLVKIAPKIVSMFHSVGGSDSCHIGTQSLYFHWMTLNKVIRAQEGILTSENTSMSKKVAWIDLKNTNPKSPPK